MNTYDLREDADALGRDIELVELLRKVPTDGWAVWPFHKAPLVLRDLCSCNGGDEDWICVTRADEYEWCAWVERTDTCHEPDFYLLPLGLVAYVGSHA